jgi:hypothetical protein
MDFMQNKLRQIHKFYRKQTAPDWVHESSRLQFSTCIFHEDAAAAASGVGFIHTLHERKKLNGDEREEN